MHFSNGDQVCVRVNGTGKLAGVRFEFNGHVLSATANSQVLVVEGWKGERYVLLRGWGESSYRDLAIREIEAEVKAISHQRDDAEASRGTAYADGSNRTAIGDDSERTVETRPFSGPG